MQFKTEEIINPIEKSQLLEVITVFSGAGVKHVFGPISGNPVIDEKNGLLYIIGSYRNLLNVIYRYDSKNDQLSIVNPLYISKIKIAGDNVLAEWAEGIFTFKPTDFKIIDFAPIVEFLQKDRKIKSLKHNAVSKAYIFASHYQFWIADDDSTPLKLDIDYNKNCLLQKAHNEIVVFGSAHSNIYPVRVLLQHKDAEPSAQCNSTSISQVETININSGRLLIGGLLDEKENASITTNIEPGHYEIKVTCTNRGQNPTNIDLISPKNLNDDFFTHAEKYEIHLKLI